MMLLRILLLRFCGDDNLKLTLFCSSLNRLRNQYLRKLQMHRLPLKVKKIPYGQQRLSTANVLSMLSFCFPSPLSSSSSLC